MPRSIAKTSEQIIQELREDYGNKIVPEHVRQYCQDVNISYPAVTKRLEPYKVSRGFWNLDIEVSDIASDLDFLENSYSAPAVTPPEPKEITVTRTQNTVPPKPQPVPTAPIQNIIPKVDLAFVPFGNFSDIKKIIKSKLFYPTFITGLSGNGKTHAVNQACAQLGRELIRVNITIETDDDDLIGGYRMNNGNTIFHHGPVVEAMKRGAILLLDEVDLASNKIMCLQPILEGTGLFIKKTGEYIEPAKGFNIIATANTKGKGSDDGRFIGTNILNEAFLERFSITLEQDYPTPAIEQKILINYMQGLDCVDKEFAEKLCTWASIIRKSFADGAMDEVITTRRLIHLIKAYSIFNDKKKAVELICNRFDTDTKNNFVEFYSKIDADINNIPDNSIEEQIEEELEQEEILEELETNNISLANQITQIASDEEDEIEESDDVYDEDDYLDDSIDDEEEEDDSNPFEDKYKL